MTQPTKKKIKQTLNTSKEARYLISKYSIITPMFSGIPYIYENGFYNCINSINRLRKIISFEYVIAILIKLK